MKALSKPELAAPDDIPLLLERLTTFPWFASCGRPLPESVEKQIDLPLYKVKTWKQAQKHYTSHRWFNARVYSQPRGTQLLGIPERCRQISQVRPVE